MKGSANKGEPQPVAHLPVGDARTFTKLMDDSVSPSGRLAVAVGTRDRSRPEWLLVEQDGRGRPSFMVSDQFNIANYLVSLADFRVLALLDSNHSGTAAGYNHETAAFHWSLDSRWLVEEHQWKWHTAQCTVHRLNTEGQPLARLDLRVMANEVLLEQLLRSVPGSKAGDMERYAVRIETINIANDGILTAKLSAQIPKQEEYLEATVTAQISEAGEGRLSVQRIKE